MSEIIIIDVCYHKHNIVIDKENNETCFFICPFNGIINKKTLCFTDRVSTSKFWNGDIYNTRFKNERLNQLFRKYFVESKIFYSTDLCGTDFKQVINFTIKK